MVPDNLVPDLLANAHANTGHGAWQTVYLSIRQESYFTRMAERCQELVANCTCQCANSPRGQTPPPPRIVMPDRQWSVLKLDTFELGAYQAGEFHCGLVCIDAYSKWVEISPLRRHDAESAAVQLHDCCRLIYTCMLLVYRSSSVTQQSSYSSSSSSLFHSHSFVRNGCRIARSDRTCCNFRFNY